MQKKQKIHIEDIEKRQLYTVPDNYFDDLPANIRRRLNTKQKGEIFSYPWFKYSISVAGLLLVLLLGYTWFIPSQPADPHQLISEVAEVEIMDYLQLQELSQYDIIEAVSDTDTTFEDQFFQQTDINLELLMDETDYETIQDYI